MPVRIRKVDPFHDEDAAEDLRFLDALCFLPSDAPLVLDEAHWWIAYDKEKPVAYAGVSLSKGDAGWGYLCRAGVHPDYRGQGLQKRLIKTRIRFARMRGWLGLRTDTSHDNVNSANSLITCGFKLFKPKVPWSFSNANYWRLQW